MVAVGCESLGLLEERRVAAGDIDSGDLGYQRAAVGGDDLRLGGAETAVGGEGPGQGRGTEAVETAVQHKTVGVPAAASNSDNFTDNDTSNNDTNLTSMQTDAIAAKKQIAMDKRAFRNW